MRKEGHWDIRCPKALKEMFPVRRGYYYKVNREQAHKICALLCKAYDIKDYPDVSVDIKFLRHIDACGCYIIDTQQILMCSRNHMKTIFHEFYHHLDSVTHGKYNSDDRKRLAHEFADRLWEKFRRREQ